jgi:hypothetical protein
MEVSGELHTPTALSRGKRPRYQSDKEAGQAPGPAWTLGNRETFLDPAGNQIPAGIQPTVLLRF